MENGAASAQKVSIYYLSACLFIVNFVIFQATELRTPHSKFTQGEIFTIFNSSFFINKFMLLEYYILYLHF